MESEKVEKIKKALECCKGNTCTGCPYDNNECGVECMKELAESSLSYINELESENERLLEQRNKTYNIWVKDTEKLKDRIAELEKENKELLKENEGWHGSYRCAIDKIGELSAERYIKVEKFAEMLKAKMPCEEVFKGIWDKIDETLKEFKK